MVFWHCLDEQTWMKKLDLFYRWKPANPASSFCISLMSIYVPIFNGWKQAPQLSHLAFYGWAFCALFYGWKKSYQLSYFAFNGWASVPYFMDENKHTTFLLLHFLDEHLCLFVWMKKSTPGFSFFILWTSICALFYGWKNATQLLILHFMTWFYG